MDEDDPGAGYATMDSQGGLPNKLGWEKRFRFFGQELVLWENRPLAVWDASYGLVAWNAALVLSGAIETGLVPRWPVARLRGARVLDVGAGTGIFGLAVAAAGARAVLTDYEPRVIQQLQANADANGALLSDRVRCQRLDWCNPADSAPGSAVFADAVAFDLVVAADLLYNDTEHSWPELVTTLAALAGPGTDVLVGYEVRPNVDQAEFFRLAEPWFAAEPIELPPSLFTELQARQYEGDLGKGKAGKVKAAILRPRPLVQPSL
jgi:predicted nicotinamide N-methyase